MKDNTERVIVGDHVRESTGRLEGIVLFPPQLTVITESSFSRVKVYWIWDNQRVSDIVRKFGTKKRRTPSSSSYINTQSTSLAAFSVPVNS